MQHFNKMDILDESCPSGHGMLWLSPYISLEKGESDGDILGEHKHITPRTARLSLSPQWFLRSQQI